MEKINITSIALRRCHLRNSKMIFLFQGKMSSNSNTPSPSEKEDGGSKDSRTASDGPNGKSGICGAELKEFLKCTITNGVGGCNDKLTKLTDCMKNAGELELPSAGY